MSASFSLKLRVEEQLFSEKKASPAIAQVRTTGGPASKRSTTLESEKTKKMREQDSSMITHSIRMMKTSLEIG